MKNFLYGKAIPGIVVAKYWAMGLALTMLLLIMFVATACGSGK